MTEGEYRLTVQQIRMWIDQGTEDSLQRAEEHLAELRAVYPKRLFYIAAEAALMLAKGADAEDCRAVIDCAVQEFHPQEGLADLFALKGQTFREDSPERRQLAFLTEFYETGVLPQQEFAALAEMQERFCAGQMDLDGFRVLAEQYYVTRNTLLSFVLMMAWCRQSGHMDAYEENVLWDAGQPYSYPAFRGNYGVLAQLLTDDCAYTFLLLADETNAADMDVLSEALQLLGQHVILLQENDVVKTTMDPDAYAKDCVQEAVLAKNRIVINVGKFRASGGEITDGIPALIRLLTNSIEQKAPLIVFASDRRMAQLHEHTALGGDIQRLSGCLPPPFSYAGAFAWTGSYLKYVSYLYGEPVEELLAAPPACDFSIVIPVRNTADTLRYTLMTCLAIDYDGSYEIVLSDNSADGCTAVRDLYEEIGDERIRYYKTPHQLFIDKSFEFALLHARGEFIFSIGADDGVYPWALNYLRKALADYPKEELFSWPKGFYSWPGFFQYKREIVTVPLYDAEQKKQYIQYGLVSHSEHIVRGIEKIFYALPLFYINSGFRRTYLRTLLQRTGRLVDGASQDSYIGAANLFLNDHVIQLCCPLTVAGMSEHSVGANSVLSKKDLLVEARTVVPPHSLHGTWGDYVMRDREWRVPRIPTADKSGFYITMTRLQDLNVIDEEADETLIFDYFLRRIYLTDTLFELSWGLLLYAAELRGEKLYQACRQRYAALCANPERRAEPVQIFAAVDKRGYDIESSDLTLDAQSLGCYNIADAVVLTAKILNL